MPRMEISMDTLPDDVLHLIFSHLPCLPARALPDVMTLGTLGAAERTCRRWRRLALGLAAQHPLHLRCSRVEAAFLKPADLRSAGENETVQCILHCLCTRAPVTVDLRWRTPALCARLAFTQLPAVRKLMLWGGDAGTALLPSLPHIFPSLDELCTIGPIGDDTLTIEYGQAFPALLRHLPHLTALELKVPTVTADLAAALLALPRLQSVRMMLEDGPLPEAATWRQLHQLGPRLRHILLSIKDQTERVPRQLEDLPPDADLQMHVSVETLHPDFRLDALPTLQELELYSNSENGPLPLPRSCWECSHLTSLRLCTVAPEMPAGTLAMLSTLRCLDMDMVEFEHGHVISQMILLPCLTYLKLRYIRFPRPCLPEGLSNLSCLRKLVIEEPEEEPDALGISRLRLLPALTHLKLASLTFGELPQGAMYPASLEHLTIEYAEAELLCSLLSPALFTRHALQRLSCTLEPKCLTVMNHWQNLEAGLKAHPSLQELCVQVYPEAYPVVYIDPSKTFLLLKQKLTESGITAALRDRSHRMH